MLKSGEKAPQFSYYNQEGKKVNLIDYKGKKVILYFYPKDNTPGCTSEACNLRDNIDTLANKGFVVIGVSKDSSNSHQKFITKYELPFDLIADTEKEIVKLYEVWGKKKFMGKESEGVLRTTYIINEVGLIEHVITKVNTGNHAQQILELYN